MITTTIPACFLPMTSAEQRERLWDSHRRNSRRSAAKVRTKRAKDVTRAYFRRLTREGVALDVSGRLASNRDRAQLKNTRFEWFARLRSVEL